MNAQEAYWQVLTLLFPSACTGRRRVEMKLAVHSKLRSLGHRHAVGPVGLYYAVNPASSGSSSGSETRTPGIVDSAGWLTHGRS